MSTVKLGSHVYQRAALELGGYVFAQLLRLGSNLILTRLLFPEAFGLAGLVSILILGLQMLSDAGFEQSVVQNKNGDKEGFLNTVWTLGIIRGMILFSLACICAKPMAFIYGEPILSELVPFAAFSMILGGFDSTSLFVARRRLDVLPLIKIDLASQVISLVVVLLWVTYHPTVWALVFSGLISTLVKMISSHFLRYGPANRLMIEKDSALEIFHFGKWIFGSTALTFLSMQADRMLIGGFIGVATLGVYSIAVFFGEAARAAVWKINAGILFPILSGVARDSQSSLGEIFYSARLKTDFLGVFPVGALAVVAPSVIQILYDDRYHAAGWMLQLLCIKVGMSIVIETIQSCLFSMGQTKQGFVNNLIRSFTLAAGIPIGWQFGGLEGLILSVALSEVPVLLYIWSVFFRFGLLRVEREVLSFLVFFSGVIVGYIADWFLSLII